MAKDYRTVNNIARLLNLPPKIQQAVREEKISGGHAKVLAGIKEQDKLWQAFEKILSGNFSVRDTERLARQMGTVKTPPKSPENEKFRQLELNLSEKLATPVSVQSGKENKGKISIRFTNLEHLNDIVKKILD